MHKLFAAVFSFPDDYSKWLSEHLQHLKSGSIKILGSLDPGDFENIRYSTVVELGSDGDIIPFKYMVKGITKGMTIPKRTLLQTAVKITQKHE